MQKTIFLLLKQLMIFILADPFAKKNFSLKVEIVITWIHGIHACTHKSRKKRVRRKIGMQMIGTQNELRYPLLDRNSGGPVFVIGF